MAKTNDAVIRTTTDTLRDMTRSLGVEVSLAMVFGSRARGDFTADSDVLLVSPDFEGTPFAKRSQELYLQWPYESLPPPEFLCFTSDEFEDRKANPSPTIINTILKEGIVIIESDDAPIP